MKTFNTVSFTGHRTQYFDSNYNEQNDTIKWVKNALYRVIKELIDKRGAKHFISGGAIGVDCWSAEIVLWLRDKENRDITLEIAKPFPSYDKKWSDGDRRRYGKICNKSNEVNILQPEPYAHWKYHHRNSYLVKKCDILVAVLGKTEGKSGTASCVSSAKFAKVPIVMINPTNRTIKLIKPEKK